MKILFRCAWIMVIGLAIMAWALFGLPPAPPTSIFSDNVLLLLLRGAIFLVGAILTAVLYTREQNRIRELRHRGL